MNTHSPLTSVNNDFRILSVNFNQDQGCFAYSHEQGFLVYNTNPIDLRVKRTFFPTQTHPGTGIGHVTMLHRTNYLALVGGGKNPRLPNNKLIIWDDLKRKSSLSLEFMSPILNVLLSRIRIVVVLKNQVLVYGFSSTPKKFASYETISNDYGLADLSVNFSKSPSSTRYQTLAFPGRQVGQLQIVDVSPSGQEKNLISIIKAHKSSIRCLALSRSGSMVASASELGTIIRIHSTQNTAQLYEFRRGLDRAVISSMKFSPDDTKLAVLSDKNTLHVFNLLQNTVVSDSQSEHSSQNSVTTDHNSPVNRKHIFNKLPVPLPFNKYFKSVWSFCSVNTSKYHQEYDSEYANDEGSIGWSGNDSIVIIWKLKRTWEKYIIAENTGAKATDHQWELVRASWKELDNPND
ncbi:WD40 repeat-like protein [Yamadazyma tenuis ATCC 10573]|uniref:WD40 repeat-like protein n=1 Tax=Candida tenuis (strain ATCC 10573 / BCRC 21748 / CBS 615 / JCM 9827 / NBRC 10315 / NRRL Y-1498 / VKM Y-70) TaxID=590646 RepID=G3B2P8_CANTC|nr:WD40 repeat-like protein [Yamadazyma tenuis ATCC 10573]EGV64728.1 WD40 repeat-like protein [Yamadazyma tenuis ATCC 10573]